MRQLLFFDLPTDSARARKNYRKFREFLLADGWIMLQFSVYSKLSLNNTQADAAKSRVARKCPADGAVVILKVTERQFASMDYLAGERDQSVANSADRVVFLGGDDEAAD